MKSQHNAKLFLGLPKRILSIFGLWMLPHRDRPYKLYNLFVLTVHWGFMFIYITHTWMVRGDVDEMSEVLFVLFTHISTCYKFSNFVIRRNTFKGLLDAMDTMVFTSKSEQHDAILTKHSTRVRKINLLLVGSAFINCLQFSLVPLLDRTQKLLPLNIWMPCDTQSSPSYEMAYALQLFMMFSGSQLFLAIDVVFVSLVTFFCAQLEMIMVDTKQIQEVPISGLSSAEQTELINHNNHILSQCIRHHQATIRFLEQIKDMFHIAIFIQITGSIMIICFVALRISTEPPNTVHFLSSLNYLCLMLAQVFLYCWSGNEITIRNEQLRDWLYNCSWDGNGKKFGCTLCIALECLRRPVVFRAGNYIPLLRTTFVSIVRCSYSYYAVIKQRDDSN